MVVFACGVFTCRRAALMLLAAMFPCWFAAVAGALLYVVAGVLLYAADGGLLLFLVSCSMLLLGVCCCCCWESDVVWWSAAGDCNCYLLLLSFYSAVSSVSGICSTLGLRPSIVFIENVIYTIAAGPNRKEKYTSKLLSIIGMVNFRIRS